MELKGRKGADRGFPVQPTEGVQSTEALSWQKAEGWDKHRG